MNYIGLAIPGQLVGVLPAYWLPYYHVAFVNSSVPAIFFLATIFIIPDSPTALTLEGKLFSIPRFKLYSQKVDGLSSFIYL